MRKLLVTSLFLFLATTANAARLGVHAGVNLGNLSYNTPVSTSTRTGLQMGAVIDQGVGSLFSIQTGLDYIQKGWVSTGITTKLDYLEVPLLLRLNLPIPIFTPFAYVGPTLGILLSGKTNFSGSTVDIDVKNSYSSTDLGLAFGGGFELALGPVSSLIVQARYGMGLSDIDNSGITTTKNKGLSITGGFLFGL